MLVKALRKNKPLILVILAVLCCMFIALPVFAEGDGSGGGKDIALGLASSEPADGQKNVPVTTYIKLTFNKNVVNLAVKDNNMKCFSLSGNGLNAPIQVIMPDDQVDFEHRRNIDIKPVQNLQPGTLYKLIISGQLRAKNGMSLGTPVTVSFTTAGAVPVNQNTNSGQNTQNTNSVKSGSAESGQQTPAAEVKTVKTAEEDDTKAASKDTEEKDDEVKSEAKAKSEEKKNKSASTKGIAVAAGLVLITAVVYGYYRYSRKK